MMVWEQVLQIDKNGSRDEEPDPHPHICNGVVVVERDHTGVNDAVKRSSPRLLLVKLTEEAAERIPVQESLQDIWHTQGDSTKMHNDTTTVQI